jgi:SAM-dependent methyltransferase
MSGFSAEWLSLREAYDLSARNQVVMRAVTDTFKGKSTPRIVDLGCGTGSTLRTLAPRLGASQAWRLLDHDRDLLDRAAASAAALNVNATVFSADLNAQLEAVLDEPADLVTMSALLDLVSGEWLDRFVNSIAERRLHVYAALTYDGRGELSPVHPMDESIVHAVNLHQRTDKGFGPALGPLAGETAISKLIQCGFVVVQGPADWVASEQDTAFQTEMVRGWAAAAREQGTMPPKDVEHWLAFREAEIAAGRTSLRVGHVDFFAVPPV